VKLAHWAPWRRKLYTWWSAGVGGGIGFSGGTGFRVVVVSVAVQDSFVGTGFSDSRGFIGWYWFQWQ